VRALIAAVSLAALGSCNDVYSEAPMFAKADTVGVPAIRSGIWRGQTDSPCAFDAKQPATSWPSCAPALQIKDGALALFEENGGRRQVTPMGEVLLARGRPSILQIGPISGGGLDARSDRRPYLYLGVRVIKQDDRGRIVALRFWEVECRSPASAAKTPASPGSDAAGNAEPLPGLAMDKDGSDCTATSPQAVRSAAAASETWATVESVTWVRDGDI
jgi:hypothetical protein